MNKIALYQKLPFFLKGMIASYKGSKLNQVRQQNRNEFLEDIHEVERWSKEKIESYQNQLLRETLEYAVKHVPYYREFVKVQESMQPNFNYLDIHHWPILEKSTIRLQPEQFISDEYTIKDLVPISTSGTTGNPMKFYFTEYTISYWYAMVEARMRNWNGVSETDMWGNFGGQLVVDSNRKTPPFWVHNKAMNQVYFSSYHISPQSVKEYLDAIKKFKIVFLLGYVSSLYSIASEGLKQGLHMPMLKLVITNAEPLLVHQRETIEKAFSCKVVQTYSGCEFAFCGTEDLNQVMYVWPEAGYMETVDQQNRSTESDGQLVVTSFLNKAMPLIRYRVGDTVRFSKAKKGNLNFTILEEITGRTDDLILAEDGRFIGRLDPVFKTDLNIKEAQIIQEELLKFRIVVVPDKNFNDNDKFEIETRLMERVGRNILVEFELVKQIPRTANGKFKAVISKLHNS